MQCSIILTYTDIVIESYDILLGLHTNKVTQIAMFIHHIGCQKLKWSQQSITECQETLQLKNKMNKAG